MRLLDRDDRVLGNLIAGLEEREHRVRRVFLEAIVSFAPELDEVGGGHVPDDPLRPIGEVERSTVVDSCYSLWTIEGTNDNVAC